ncbi:peroxiredoxin [Salinactinospora qingdaonensis]|uniref:Peroxiredoxin n=1 Tax=Salinactinospora qingdaonensis TaxID=702744 RepID=A0ABP7EZA4_9ACTN
MSIEVGQKAPDFELADQHGQRVKLSDFRGRKNVILVFHPLAFSGVCSGELGALRDNIDEFQNDTVQLLTVSVDSMFAHRAWAEQENLDYPLLSDFWPHGEVAQAYGVFDDTKGVALRGTFLIDKEGVVRWTVVNPVPEARDLADYRKALAELS